MIFLKVDGLVKVYNIYSSQETEPSLKKSAVEQIAIMLQGKDNWFDWLKVHRECHAYVSLKFGHTLLKHLPILTSAKWSIILGQGNILVCISMWIYFCHTCWAFFFFFFSFSFKLSREKLEENKWLRSDGKTILNWAKNKHQKNCCMYSIYTNFH